MLKRIPQTGSILLPDQSVKINETLPTRAKPIFTQNIANYFLSIFNTLLLVLDFDHSDCAGFMVMCIIIIYFFFLVFEQLISTKNLIPIKKRQESIFIAKTNKFTAITRFHFFYIYFFLFLFFYRKCSLRISNVAPIVMKENFV